MNVPPDLVFFTDRNLGKQFPEILRQAGISVEKHADHFADDAKDEEWLAEIGRRRWYALTNDRRIRSKPNEKEAVRKFAVGLFILIGKVPTSRQAHNFIQTLPKIARFIDKNPCPFIAKIYHSQKGGPGSVKMWEPF